MSSAADKEEEQAKPSTKSNRKADENETQK